MNEWVQAMGWSGIFAPVALGAIGSVMGCAIAGQAAIGTMTQTDSGYGRVIGLSVLPSSFVIYGIVLMFTLQRSVDELNAGGLFGIGILAGLALMFTGIWQGRSRASAINASREKPEIFALSIAPAAIVEGFGVFVFIFALVLSGSLPSAAGGAL